MYRNPDTTEEEKKNICCNRPNGYAGQRANVVGYNKTCQDLYKVYVLVCKNCTFGGALSASGRRGDRRARLSRRRASYRRAGSQLT